MHIFFSPIKRLRKEDATSLVRVGGIFRFAFEARLLRVNQKADEIL